MPDHSTATGAAGRSNKQGADKRGAGRWGRLLDRVRAIRRSGGARLLLQWLRVVARMRAARWRAPWWRLSSALCSRRIRAKALRANEASGESAPAFDLRGYNPIGRRRGVENEAAALGPLDLLPPGASARRVMHLRDLRGLRRMSRVEDTAAFYPDAAARAGALARLAAAGVAVHLADGGPGLRPLLGGDLYRLMTADADGLDADAREMRGVEMRRAALREHSSWARARRLGREELPLVSILLVTRRPSFLPWALANAARQTYPKKELVLALHGEGFSGVERQVAALPFPAKTLRAPAAEPLGAVFKAASEASGGALLSRMDDDDLYGADHLWDLVLAREYSGAQLVGKWREFVYLAASDRTIRRFHGGGERYQALSLPGGAVLISRCDLDRAGGWRKMPEFEDSALIADVLRAGGRVYRAHAAGFMMVRHGFLHNWYDSDGDDGALLAKADRVWAGFQPARAGIEAPALPYPAPKRAKRSSGREPCPQDGS